MSNLWSISDNSCKTSRRMKRILLSLMVIMVLAASASAQRLRERLHSFQQFREFCQCNNIDMRKGCLAEYIKMMVVGYNISGTSRNSTINKFVIVRICLNHLEMVVGSDKFYKRTIDNGLDDQFCSLVICQTLQNLKVFFQYLIGYAKHISSPISVCGDPSR